MYTPVGTVIEPETPGANVYTGKSKIISPFSTEKLNLSKV